MLNKLSDFLSAIIAPASVENRPEHTLQMATAVLLIEVMQSDADSTSQEQALRFPLKFMFHGKPSKPVDEEKRWSPWGEVGAARLIPHQ